MHTCRMRNLAYRFDGLNFFAAFKFFTDFLVKVAKCFEFYFQSLPIKRNVKQNNYLKHSIASQSLSTRSTFAVCPDRRGV